MADTESIGGISVSIGGDISPLVAAGAKATQVSAQIGSNVAGAFNTAAAGVNRFDAAIQSLSTTIGEQNAALSLSIQRNMAMAQSVRSVGQESQRSSFSIVYLIKGIKDVAEGRGTFALAEMANELRTLGPLAIGVGAAIAGIAGAAYGIFKLTEYFKALPEAARAASAPFRELNDSLQLTNDKMQVANDRTYAEISKLTTGLPSNGLNTALDEAVVAADELADALGKDNRGINELLQKQNVGGLKAFFTHQVSTTDVKEQMQGVTGAGGFAGQIADITDEGTAKIRSATSAESQHAAQTELNARLTAAYSAQIAKLRQELTELPAKAATSTDALTLLSGALSSGHVYTGAPANVTRATEEIKATIRNLEEQQKSISLRQGAADEQSQKEGIERDQAAARQKADQQLTVLNAQEAAGKAASEQARVRAQAQIESEHQIRQAAIEAIDDPQTRRAAAANDAVQVARDEATKLGSIDAQRALDHVKYLQATIPLEQAGKPKSEQNNIATKIGAEINTTQTEAATKSLEALAKVDKAEGELGIANVTAQREWADEVTKAWLQSAEERQKQARETAAVEIGQSAYTFEAQQRVAQIQAKGQGRADELRIERSLIALEAQYDEQSSHSAQQQINYARQKAALEAQARQAKLTGLEADLKIAQAEAQAKAGTEAGVEAAGKAAEIEQQIAQLKQQNANADAKDALAVQELNDKLTEQLSIQEQITNAKNAAASTAQANQLSIGAEIGQAIGNLPKSVGDDIGGAISDSLLTRHPGKSIGQEMAKELTDSLKSTLGDILKKGISSLVQLGFGFLGFSDGTDSAPGGLAMVGEKGPEIMHVPRGAQIIPNHKIKGYADGVGLGSARSDATTSSRSTVAFGDIHFHAHGISNPRQFAEMAVREIPGVLKARSPQFSPYSK